MKTFSKNPFYITIIFSGTVSAIESFPSRCPINGEQDYVLLANSIVAIVYLSLFIISNIILKIVFRNEEQENFQNFSLKTLTIGVAFVAAVLGFLGIIQFLPNSDFDMKANYMIITVCNAALVLYIIKENEFTFPFLLSLFQQIRCTDPNAVDPIVPIFPMQELNPRTLRVNQDCRIKDLEDDGGIFMG